MKILLLHKGNKKDSQCASENEQEQNEISLGLLSIFGLLKEKGFDVEIKNLSNYDWPEIEEFVREKNPAIVGITCYTKNRFTVAKLAETIKKINLLTKVILGGPHATHLYQQILAHYPAVDIIVRGEGEFTALELAEAIQNGKLFGEHLDSIKGIAYRKEGEVIRTPDREPIINLDELPLTAKYYPSKNIITSRGCPGSCIFCSTPQLWGRKLRFRSAKNVVDELELMAQEGITDNIYIADDTFTVSKKRTIEICRGILERGLKITWYCNARVDFICEERLFWMKKAGCARISYGVESGSPRMLKNLQKQITVEQILKAAELTRKFGIHLRLYFITGTPGENEETIAETIEVIEKAKPNWITTCLMTVYPGTQIWELYKEKNNLSDDFWQENGEENQENKENKENTEIKENKNENGGNKENVLYTCESSQEELLRLDGKITAFFDSRQKEFEYSVGEREKLVELFPESSLAYLELAETCNDHGLFERAIDAFEKALHLGVNPATAYLGLAVVYLQKGDYAQAIDFSRKAISGDQRIDALAHKISGDSYFKLGEKKKAVDAWKRALEFDPTDERMKVLVGRYAVNE